MIAVTVFAPACSTRANSYQSKLADEMQTSSRANWFYSSMAHDRTRAEDIRIYRQDEFCREKLEKTGKGSLSARLARYARGPIGGFQALGAAASNVFMGIAYAFVCVKAWTGAFGVGAVTQYIGAITALSGSVSSLLSTLGKMRNNAEFLIDTFQFLDIPNNLHRGGSAVSPDAENRYEIEFHNVSFRYPGSEVYALQNVSFRMNAGDNLAVVGQNGSGKTTFIKLLCRLYDPTEGSITINGTDIRALCYEEYLKLFSVVFQDFRLPAFKLGQDVAAAEKYDSGRAFSCLEKAGFEARLDTLPDGLETPLYRDFDKNGVEVSGGEAQKIALARALYKDAPFIVLDEPTAALDPIAEFEVYSKFNEIVGEKTAVYISHRLSSCRFCHDIAVFDKGELVQRGSHDELSARPGGCMRISSRRGKRPSAGSWPDVRKTVRRAMRPPDRFSLCLSIRCLVCRRSVRDSDRGGCVAALVGDYAQSQRALLLLSVYMESCSAFHMAAYFPPFASSSSCEPCSAIRPPATTRI